MTKRDKLRRKLRNNPTNVTMEEVETLLTRFGFILVKVSGSHHIYEYDNSEQTRQIVVPLYGHKVKKVYVQEISDMIDDLFPYDVQDNEEANEDNNE